MPVTNIAIARTPALIESVRPRGYRSEITPITGPNTRFGQKRTAQTKPVKNADPVMSRTSQPTMVLSSH